MALLSVLLPGCESAHRGADASSGSDAAGLDAAVAGSPDAAPRPDVAVPPDAPPPCVEGDANKVDPASGHCYLMFAAEKSWPEARSACEALDAHLVTILSLEEHELLIPLVGPERHVWLGATDADEEKTWIWITGEPWGFENWGSGEPNNEGGEDCAELRGDWDHDWNDDDCDKLKPYICERSAGAPQ